MAESREGRAWPSLQLGWGGARDPSSVRIPESQLLNNADPLLRGGAVPTSWQLLSGGQPVHSRPRQSPTGKVGPLLEVEAD